MIELRVEDYCQSCTDFEADVNKDYAGEFNRFVIFCKHRNKCMTLKNYIEGQTVKKTSQYPIKTKELCGSCEYNFYAGCHGRHCDQCEMRDKDTGHCYCITVDDGEECPCYKEYKEAKNERT